MKLTASWFLLSSTLSELASSGNNGAQLSKGHPLEENQTAFFSICPAWLSSDWTNLFITAAESTFSSPADVEQDGDSGVGS